MIDGDPIMDNEQNDIDEKTWQHVFDTPGNKKILINKNLASIIRIIRDKTKITQVTLGDGISAIHDGCFQGFSELSSVYGGKNCRFIGDHAFKDCTRLQFCEMLNNYESLQYGKYLENIGAEAFRNTALKRIRLRTYIGDYALGIQERAFADCKSLTSVGIYDTENIPKECFSGCTELRTFSSNERAFDLSHIQEKAFENCKKLNKIFIPFSTVRIEDRAFSGCSELFMVKIEDNQKKPSQLMSLGKNVFDCCGSLTSLSLPGSISGLNQIDQEFLSGSEISVLTLKGIDDQVIKSRKQTIGDIPTDEYGYIITREGMTRAYKDAMERGIPIVVATNYYLHPEVKQGCAWCKGLTKVLRDDNWNQFMSRYKNNCYFFYGSYLQDIELWKDLSYGDERKGNIFPNWFKINHYSYYPYKQAVNTPGPSSTIRLFAKLTLYWKKPGEEPKSYPIYVLGEDKNYINGKTTNQTRAEFIQDIIKSSSQVIDQEEKSETYNISKFGSELDNIMLITKQNTTYTIGNDQGQDEPVEFEPPVPDDTTTDNFQPGVWYSQSKSLKEYVDENHLPCFVIFSNKDNEQFRKFNQNIYNNYYFQKWVKKQDSCLFCKIETESQQDFQNTTNKNQYYVYSTWAKRTKLDLPCMIYYWKRPYGTEESPQMADVTWNISSFQDSGMDHTQFEEQIMFNFYGDDFQEEQYKDGIRPGLWINDTDRLLDMAEENHIPVVVVATAAGCENCSNFKSQIMQNQKFKDWVSSSPYLFCYCFSGSGWFTTEKLRRVMNLIGDGGLPRVGGYWIKENGTVVGGKSETIVGAGLNVDYYINKFDTLFAEYKNNHKTTT